MTTKKIAREDIDYFGGCPECYASDGYINIGREHVFYCADHKTAWSAGFNLFSSWRNETEDEQRAEYDRLGFGEFAKVQPVYSS
jgi:hypothetical protein